MQIRAIIQIQLQGDVEEVEEKSIPLSKLQGRLKSFVQVHT